MDWRASFVLLLRLGDRLDARPAGRPHRKARRLRLAARAGPGIETASDRIWRNTRRGTWVRTSRPEMFSKAGFVVACLICILLAHYAAVLVHEYAHSFMAFALGYKSDPLVIHFGGKRVANLLLLININEQVDYAAMFARGDGPAAALIGFAGPGLANGTMYLLSLFLLRRPSVRRNVFHFMLVFWFNLMNVGNFY